MSQTVGVEGWAAGLGSLRHHFSLCGVRGVLESPSQPGLSQEHPRREMEGHHFCTPEAGWIAGKSQAKAQAQDGRGQ